LSLFLQAQYRSKQNFTWESLQGATNGLEHLRNQVSNLGSEVGKISNEYKDIFVDYLSDDFNIPGAFSVVVKLLKSEINNGDKLATIIDFDRVLGLNLKSDKYIVELSEFNIESDFKISDDLINLIKERQNAKLNKEWNKSDNIRNEIRDNFSCTLEDSKDLVKVKKI
jgi:cysteinyl-tRNA synthetase